MKLTPAICIFFFLLLVGCRNTSHNDIPVEERSNVIVANEFVDAFYSFDSDSLAFVLAYAKESQPNILYYQKWAECGNYEIVKRGNAVEKNDSLLLLPIIVRDDLMGSLQINFNVTDTFHLSLRNGHIRSVETSSNDPDQYYTAKEWVKKNRPGYVEKQCEGIWNGGPTPCECIKGMIKGFAEFIQEGKAIKSN